jgi:pimeloyl-ACP methyl ester carboxylesterase
VGWASLARRSTPMPGRCRIAQTCHPDPAAQVPAELPAVVPSHIASGGRPLLRLIRSAIADRSEDQVQRLTMPSVVITGRRDGFAPPAWARRAIPRPPRRTHRLLSSRPSR